MDKKKRKKKEKASWPLPPRPSPSPSGGGGRTPVPAIPDALTCPRMTLLAFSSFRFSHVGGRFSRDGGRSEAPPTAAAAAAEQSTVSTAGRNKDVNWERFFFFCCCDSVLPVSVPATRTCDGALEPRRLIGSLRAPPRKEREEASAMNLLKGS